MRILIAIILVTSALHAQVNPIDGSMTGVAIGPGASGQPETSVDVAVNQSGDGVIVWRQALSTTPFPTYQLWAQPLRRGNAQGPAIPLAQTSDWYTFNQTLSVRCAIDEQGNWAAVWDDTEQASLLLVVRGRRFHAATGQLGPILLISDEPGLEHRWLPDVAMGRFGGSPDPHWYVTWNYGTQVGQSTIRMRRFRVSTTGPTPVDAPSPVIDVNSEPTTAIENQLRSAIAIDDTGTLTIVWEKFAQWGLGSPFWRIMARRRAAGNWLQIDDPTATGAHPVTGLDPTDWEVSGASDPAAQTSPLTPPRVAVAPNGNVLIGWRRGSGAPYSFRTLTPASNGAQPGPIIPHLPWLWSAGHRRFDIGFTSEGSFLLAWEHLATASTSGRIMFSRVRPNGLSAEEFTVDATSGVGVTSVTMAASDSGQVQVCWARGSGVSLQRAWRRELGLSLFALQPIVGPSSFRIAIPGAANLPYFLWPLSEGGTAAHYALTAIGDGRAADASLADPLLQWHLAQGMNTPLLPNGSGTLDASGEAIVNVALPPGVGPVSVTWSLLVTDPTRPWPRELLLFTQPRTFVIN